MASTAFLGLVGANSTASVLDNFKNASGNLKTTLNDALNSALKSQLSDMLTKASLPAIAGLVAQMPPSDIVAASSLTVQVFAKQQLDPMVAKDPAMQQAVDAELAKLSDTTTIGATLQLDTPLGQHPLFQADVMKADIASLLATSPTIGQNQQLQIDFINRYAASTGTIQDFWNQLSNENEFKAAVPEFQFTLQLGTLTLNNAPLVDAIRKKYRPASMRDLTTLSASDWTQLITSNNVSTPASISGANAAEKTTNYVNAILGALRSAFPTDYIAQNLAVNPQDNLDQEVAQFLKQAPEFNLITTNLQRYLANNPTALPGIPAGDKSAFLRRLGGYQRLTRINSDPQIVTALASKGLDSAYKISSLPRSAFLGQYSQQLGGSDKAQAVYASAQQVTAATTNFYMTVREGLSKAQPWVFGDVSTEVSTAVQQIPNWQELFGSTSTCACQECRSVLSAAAYFVDLLHFLSQAHIDPNNLNSSTLYTILTGRRPDLADLKLNCENTNTTLPYVDLVNEILESVVMTHTGDPPRPPAHDTPTDATPDQLSVNPEFTNDAAYLLLANAYYPFSLPFDRFLTIARSYLQFAGSSLYGVMRTFQIGADLAVPANTNPAPSDQAIALEYLKISANESLILTGQPFQGTSPQTNPVDLAKYYGETATIGRATISLVGAVRANNTVTITTTAPHNFSVDKAVRISGVSDGSFDGTFTIATVLSPTTFTYSQTAAPATSGGGSVGVLGSILAISPSTVLRSNNIVTTTTTAPHKLLVNDTVSIVGVRDSSFDGTVTVATVPSATSFTYRQTGPDASSGGGAVGNPVAIDAAPRGAVRAGNGVAITTVTPHKLSVNDTVSIVGVRDSSFDGTFTVATVPSATSFTYRQTGPGASSGGGAVGTMGNPVAIDSAPRGAVRALNGVAITTVTPHNLSVNDTVVISGVSDRSFDGVFSVLSVLSSATFTYRQIGTNTSSGGGSARSFRSSLAVATPGALRERNQVTITTAAPHNLSANSMVLIAGVGDASFNGQFLISAVAPNNFTYVQVATDAYSGGGTARSLGNLQTISTPGAVRTNNAVTITTTTPHDFSQHEMVTISEISDSSFDGTFAITQAPSATQFTYNQTGPNSVAGGGTATVLGKVAMIIGTPGSVRQGNVVTIATTGHQFSVNDVVMIFGMSDPSFNGTFLITKVSGTTFTYDQFGPDGYSAGGMAVEDWYTDIARASTFLEHTGISFQELVALLETHFLNPTQSIALQPDPEDLCSVDTTLIANLSPADGAGSVDFTALKNFYRFIRLYQKLGWAVSDLDAALRLIGVTDINASLLSNLSQMKQLQNKLGLTVAEVLGLWEALDTEGAESLYVSLFQNRGVLNPVNPAFTLRYTASLLSTTAVSLSILNPYGAQVSYQGGQLQLTDLTVPNGNPIPMTVNQKQFLLSLSADPNYQQAVMQIFLGSNPAPLASPPSELALPVTQLPDAIYHQGNQLFFIGRMSDKLHADLKALSQESDYQLAIDNLYDTRWAPGTEIAIATQVLATQTGQLIPAQTIPDHANTLLAALRISAIDLAAIIANLWNQSAPATPGLTPSTTGGSLGRGTYYVKVSVVDAFGERLCASETSVVVTPPNDSITVSWAPVAGAISYNVYYTTSDADAGSESLKISPTPLTSTVATIKTTATGGPVSSATAFPLNLINLSAVYRYARLARALNISAADLISLIQLIGISPFQPSVPGTPATPGTIEFVAKAQEVLQSKFSIAQLNYIYRNTAATSAGLAPQQSDLDQFVSSLQTALNAPPIEKSPTTDPTGQLLQQYLTAVLEPADVSELIQIINGTAQFSAPLLALPSITLPNLKSGVITFDQTDPTKPLLKFKGSLSAADDATLLSLSTDASYQQAVESLYVQPRQFIVTKLFFLDTASFIARLIDDLNASTADKYGFVLNLLLSSIGLIVQAVSSTLKLDVAVVRLLLVGGQSSSFPALLRSILNPSLAGIADFFALLGNGLSETYFSNPNFPAGAPQAGNDPAIDFNWGPTSPPLPGLNPSAFSAKWTGQLLPGFSETYTFTMRVIPPGGTVTTKGTAVTWVSGAIFNAAWATIYIKGVVYGIQSVAADGLSLTLTSSVGVQRSAVPYYVPPAAGTVTIPVAGTNVNWVSGPTFNPAWVGATIYISGVEYSVRTVAANGTSLTLNVAAPAQTAVPYTVFNLSINGNGLSLTQLQASGSNPPPPNAGPPPIEFTATVPLVSGVLTSIELDYPNAAGSMLSGLQLGWSSLSTPKSVIAQHQLYADATFSFDKALGTFKLLSRIALLVNTFRITLGDLTYLSANPAKFEAVDPNNPNDPTKAAPFNLGALPSVPSSYIPALFNQWERLLALFTLRDALPTGDSGLLALFQAASATPAPTGSALISAIATATGWDPSELGVLLGSQSDPLISASIGFGLTASDFVDERWLVRLRSCFALMARFGVSSKQLFEWAALGASPSGTATTSGTTVTWSSGASFSTAWALATIYINGAPYSIQSVDTNTNALVVSGNAGTQTVRFYVTGFTQPFESNVARDIQAAIKAKYDDSTWVKVGKKLNDGLREASRDALVAYILAPPAKWELAVDSITTPDQLYEYFLIDVEMGACMQTSRIVQATAAVQLFVQRCLINLEQGISPAAIDTSVWEWMKNYRVWQANREVFLYPEDWIDPTLRDDKTPFFKELENELRQNPITPDTVEQAIRNYLEKLDQVARLEICATYYYLDPSAKTLAGGTNDATNDVVHVFARTFSTPHVYYYRRLVHASQYGQDKSLSHWTAWESIHVDIQGDHLIPVVWNGHPYLFWPVFSEASDTTQSVDTGGQPVPPGKTTQIQLAWSEYGHGKWSAKQVSADTVVPSYMPLIAGTVTITNASKDVSWVSGSLFSGSWVGKTIMIATGGGYGLGPIVYSPFTVEKVNGPTSLTLTTPSQTTMGNTDYYLAASSYYAGALDRRWFTFSQLATTTTDDLTFQVFIAATLNNMRTTHTSSGDIPSGVTTYSPDQIAPCTTQCIPTQLQDPQASPPIPALLQFGDPQSGVVEVGSFYIPNCGTKPIAKNVAPTDSAFETLAIPPNSVFEYMTLREIDAGQDPASPWDPGKSYNVGDLVTYNNHVYQCIQGVLGSHPDTSPQNWALTGQLSIPYLPASGSPPVNLLILGNTPSLFHLVRLKDGFDPNYSSSGLGFFAPDWQPFFYQDDLRTYFVTPQSFHRAALTNANNTAPLYNSDALRATSVSGTRSIISSSPDTVTQLRFATFWHPHVCAFIKTLNQFGFPRLLSLLTQARTNDGGIASGFALSLPSTPNSVTPVLSPGILYAEGQLYQTPPGTQPIVPPAQVGNPAFPLPVLSPMFCNPTGNFYYIPPSHTGPNTPGDAYITTIATLHGQIISLDWNASLPQRRIFEEVYSPNSDYVIPPYPTEAVDFSLTGAYAIYNWEIFFHIPYLIATLLSQNQQFSEAKKWFEYIFNPMSSSTDSIPARFWNFLPFHQCSPSDVISGQIQSLLTQLDGPMITFLSPNGGPPGTSVTIEGANFGLVQGISTVTFGGAAVAPTSWDDTQITINVPNGAASGDIVVTVGGTTSNSEPFNVGPTLGVFEAPDCDYDVHVQLQQWMQTPFDPFVIARTRTIAFRKNLVMRYLDNLIAWGDYLFTQNTRESINEATQIYVLADQILGDKPVTIPPQGTIQDYSYQALVNQGLDDFSNALVTLESTFPFSAGSAISGAGGTGSLNGAAAQSFYFCIPSNDHLLAYWDTVADRLYKIRHCMNIQGQVEELALFAPPINPALLVQAAAAGVDLSSVLNEINTPVPNYRFTFMLQKALELCAEVRSLGASLLSALEKNDAEGLSLLRSTQEIALLQAVLQIKQSQVDEANNNLAGLQASQVTTLFRQQYYQGLLSGGLSSFEQTYIAELQGSRAHQENSEMADLLGSTLALVPEITGSVSFPVPGGSVSSSFGGQELFHMTAAVSQWQKAIASFHSYQANMASIMGGWDRRSTEWNFQLQTAAKELTQIQSQIDAATVRVQIAQTDVQNQQLQITNAQAVLDFLNSKYTNQELYGWMVSQISATYFQCYRMAYGLAKRVEACLRFELGLTDSNFIQYGYWDSVRKGLQAGDGLYSDLKRMEIAYLDQNQRKYEITRYISLVMFDPIALITLKETGQCLVSLPEALFDMDYPGHYLRQIESVSLTMPCVTGPYTSVNCKLTLVSSKIRVDTVATGPEDYGQDAHFITNFAATQSIVTSSAQNDSGMFELNFRDERYLPFQGAGVISQWLIELPQDCNAFDFETISDLVINLKYSARDGGDALRAVAKQAATLSGPTDQTSLSADSVSFPAQNNLARYFSLRHEFPTEWYKFLNPLAADTAQTMLLALTKERFPFQYRGRTISIKQVDLLLRFKDIHDTKFTTGTPLGDFKAGKGGAPGLLNVYVTQAPASMNPPPQAPTQPPANANPIQLSSNPVNYNGTPYGSSVTLPTFPLLNLGLCWLQVFTSANYIGSIAPTLVDANNHLLPGIIDDLFVVCHYSAT
jgi:hypothetical protein